MDILLFSHFGQGGIIALNLTEFGIFFERFIGNRKDTANIDLRIGQLQSYCIDDFFILTEIGLLGIVGVTDIIEPQLEKSITGG